MVVHSFSKGMNAFFFGGGGGAWSNCLHSQRTVCSKAETEPSSYLRLED